MFLSKIIHYLKFKRQMVEYIRTTKMNSKKERLSIVEYGTVRLFQHVTYGVPQYTKSTIQTFSGVVVYNKQS